MLSTHPEYFQHAFFLLDGRSRVLRRVRVLLIDEHAAVRYALASVVKSGGIGEEVGGVSSGEEGVALAGCGGLDLIILDLRLGGEMTGIEACKEIKALPDAPRVLVYTSYRRAADLYLCRAAGADGYVNKSASLEELEEAIRRVAAGGSVWPEETPAVRALTSHEPFTPRERDVFELVLRGYDNPRIARELYVGLPTVKTHMRGILRKLGLQKRRDIPTSRLWEED